MSANYPPSELEDTFHRTMLNACEVSKRTLGYNTTRLRTMIHEHGGVEAAKKVIGQTEGLAQLWLLKRLDLSVEALVLKPEFASLFTLEEKQRARSILKACNNYTAPWDTEHS